MAVTDIINNALLSTILSKCKDVVSKSIEQMLSTFSTEGLIDSNMKSTISSVAQKILGNPIGIILLTAGVVINRFMSSKTVEDENGEKVEVTGWQKLLDKWNNSEIGKIIAKDVMKPLTEVVAFFFTQAFFLQLIKTGLTMVGLDATLADSAINLLAGLVAKHASPAISKEVRGNIINIASYISNGEATKNTVLGDFTKKVVESISASKEEPTPAK